MVDIGGVILVLRREVRKYKIPSVTEVADRWGDAFYVLMACILSLRTKDAVTRSASKRLFSIADNPHAMVKLSSRRIEKAIYPVGFYRRKAGNILGICRILIDRYNAKVPSEMDALLSLPGVGRKTANLVLTQGFGKLGICVDTHVHRISNRLGIVNTKSPEETEFSLRKTLPKRYWIEYNDLLVSWGQNVCFPVSPFCSACAVSNLCARKGVARHR